MFRTVATKIAHNSIIPALAGNSDLRPLQDLITAEKSVLVSLQRLSVDVAKASEALRTWGLGEGDDLGDTLSASANVLTHFSSALSQYASHGQRLRDQLKAIRTREEALDDLKRHRKSVMSQAESAEKKLIKMSPEHKNLAAQQDTLNRLRSEMRSLDSDILAEEASLGDFKRIQVKTVMGLKFGGMMECSEKGMIVGEYGKLMVAEIVEEVTPPGVQRGLYYGQGRTEELLAEAHRRVSDVVLSTIVPAPSGRPRGDYSVQDQGPSPGYGNSPWAKNDTSPTNTRYLAMPEGLENGRFLDPNSTSMSFDTPPALPHRSSSYELREGSRKNTIDEFGTSVWNSSTAGASRFNTTPSKIGFVNDGESNYMRNIDLPLIQTHRMPGPSFSSSVTETLSSVETPGGTTSVRISVDSTAPPAPEDLLHSPTYLGAGGRSESRFSRHSSALSEEPAYPEGYNDQSADEASHQGRPQSEVTDVRENRESDHSINSSTQNLNAREQDLSQRVSPSYPAPDTDVANKADSQVVGESGKDFSTAQNTLDSRPQLQQTVRTEEEERALDAAAAREVSREMETMSYNRPQGNSFPQPMHSMMTDELKSSPTQVISDNSHGPLTLTQEPPPLLPPAPPFARQGISPRPSYERLQQTSSTSSPSQSYHSPLMQARQNLPPTYEPSPTLPTPRSGHSNAPPSPQISSKPILAPLSTSARGSPEQTFSSVAPVMSKVSSSSSLPPGGRTISAAAFKRVMPRKGSEATIGERRQFTMGTSSQLQSPTTTSSSPMERTNAGDSRPLPVPPPYGDLNSGDNAGGARDYYSSGRFVTNLEDEWK